MNSKTNGNLIFVFKRIIELIHNFFQTFLSRVRRIEYDAKKFDLEFQNRNHFCMHIY